MGFLNSGTRYLGLREERVGGGWLAWCEIVDLGRLEFLHAARDLHSQVGNQIDESGRVSTPRVDHGSLTCG